MKTEIKEFIIEEHANVCSEWKAKIEEKYPDLFKSRFKNGDWIKKNSNEKIMVCISNIERSKAYGFTFKGNWITEGEPAGWTFKYNPNGWQPATDKEVKDALIAEAKKRGFKEGVKFDCARTSRVKCIQQSEDWEFYSKDNALSTFKSQFMFSNGKWATIIEEEEEKMISLNEVRERIQTIENELQLLKELLK